MLALVVVAPGCVLGALVGEGVASAGAVPMCRATQLRVSLGRPNGTAGTIYYPIVFTDTSGRCALWGFPRVQPVGSGRRPVGPPARNESVGQMAVRHVVTRGQSVSAPLGVTDTGNYPSSRCAVRAALGVEIALTGFVPWTYRALRTTVCTRLASTNVQLLVAGSTGV
ncbi:MAG: DUF4232 domain-containing protein [Acidimicrobiales bacterium]